MTICQVLLMTSKTHRDPPLFRSQKFLQFLLISVILVIVCLAVFIAVASCLLVSPMNFEAPSPLPFEADLTFAVEVISADPIARTFVMDWYPEPISQCSDSTNMVADIFLDRGLLDTSDHAFSVLPPFSPVYRFNLTALCRLETSINAAFRTVSKLLASQYDLGYPGPAQSNLQNYPFDIYFAPFALYALNPDSGEYLKLNVTRSFGIAVNFQVALQNARVLHDPNHPWLRFNLQIERSKATQIFVVMVTVTQWLTAAAFLTISAATLIYSSHDIYSEMFVIPVGSLFAFTTIRASFPGAPSGFGATIDLYTILPVLVVMSLCSFFLLLIILYRRIVDNDQTAQKFPASLPYDKAGMPGV